MLANETESACLECEEQELNQGQFGRRDFLRLVGGGAALLATGGSLTPQLHAIQNPVQQNAAPRPAEALIREYFQGLNQEQRRAVVYPWNHGAGQGGQLATRLRMTNTAFGQRIGQILTAPQRELVQRIVRAICSDEEGFRRIATVVQNDNWGGSSWQGVGANIFGDPTTNQYAWVLTAHHLTLRCDGNSEPDTAFGGPMYYGHIVDGASQRNVFNFQTRSVRNVFEALSENQRQQAIITGTPGELYRSVQLRPRGERIPGLASGDLTSDQRRLVESVMRDLLSPFRREDADEVMDIVRRTGGLERIHVAFYRDRNSTDNARWNFWRLEGPGFVWNYRVLPHVHCYVNVSVNGAAT
jgi:Protein of unknown function (DUF3500)